MLKKYLYKFDIVVFSYIAIISSLVVIFSWKMDGWWIYLLYHLATLICISFLIYAHNRFGGKFWQFARHWYGLIIMPIAFRELHYLIPAINYFGPPYLNDAILWRTDLCYFKWLLNFLENIKTPLGADILMVCYCVYYPMPVILGCVLYKKDIAKFRYATTGVLTAFLLSYLGYIIFPAIGPHLAKYTKSIAEDGAIANWMYFALIKMELKMADAFPSGHTMVTLTCLYYCRVFAKQLFWILLPFGVGILLATVYLGYHYVIDVVVGFALFPIVIVLIRKLCYKD